MEIHLPRTGLQSLRTKLAGTPQEPGRLLGAAVVVEAELPPGRGYYLADDGRRLEFVLDAAGIHPTAEGVRAAG